MTTNSKTQRLLVSRQGPGNWRHQRVGILAFDGHRYTFTYEPGVDRPLPGLPLGTGHGSERLFPIFAERVIDDHRPERTQTLAQLGLSADAGPFEVLSVSGGRRTGDTYELTPLPQPGPADIPFVVRGIRHLTAAERDRINPLTPGDSLSVRSDETNRVNYRALLVTRDGWRSGYVPDPLVKDVHHVVRSDHQLVVARVNPPAAGLHVRLLVRLTAPADTQVD